jgi:hypothetical protein
VYRIVYTIDAKMDLKESILWYKKVNKKIANDFNSVIKNSLISIAKNPASYKKCKIIFMKFIQENFHLQLYTK